MRTAILNFSFLLSLLFQPLKAEDNLPIKQFYILSIPKAGTHLIIKLASLLTNRSPYGLHHLYPQLPNIPYADFELGVLQCKENQQFSFNHLNNFGQLFEQFSKHHPEYVKILMVRDLRDALVSYAYHISASLEEQFGNIDFDQKLTMILDLQHYEVAHEYEKEVLHALNLLADSQIRMIKFEHIIGPRGRGDPEIQVETIKTLAVALNVELNHEKLAYIVENLFGNDVDPKLSGTFRSGQIGSWKTHFKEDHLQLFLEYWESYQQSFNYSMD